MQAVWRREPCHLSTVEGRRCLFLSQDDRSNCSGGHARFGRLHPGVSRSQKASWYFGDGAILLNTAAAPEAHRPVQNKRRQEAGIHDVSGFQLRAELEGSKLPSWDRRGSEPRNEASGVVLKECG